MKASVCGITSDEIELGLYVRRMIRKGQWVVMMNWEVFRPRLMFDYKMLTNMRIGARALRSCAHLIASRGFEKGVACYRKLGRNVLERGKQSYESV